MGENLLFSSSFRLSKLLMRSKSLLNAWIYNLQFLLIAAIFGEPVGTLLNSEAECEKDFEQYNIVDGLHMADFEKDYQDDP